ncbi:MAG: tRNA Delta(2)-isopentenylpyrophosphate transferase [Actinomycetota bacterium]
MPDAPVIAIVGPTAVGKTATAVSIAQFIGGEVVSTDSMQAYVGMDIGTATPTPEEMGGVPHHMLNVWSIDRPVTVVEFRDAARQAIGEIHERGSVPIVVGGSGLYVRAVLDALDFPGTDPEVRSRWEALLADQGVESLYAQLQQIDPEAAARIDPANARRIVRALEVNEITGERFRAQLPKGGDMYNTQWLGLTIERADLDARIRMRVGHMWGAGFVQEVAGLMERGLAQAPTARFALGYAPVMAFLSGELTEEQAFETTVADTSRFARRQQRWFSGDERITWWPAQEADSLVSTVGSTFT